MLHRYISQFLEYCQLADFSVRSIQALSARLNEFEACLWCSQGECRKSQRIRSVKKITYRHLVNFVADYKAPSIHVRKSRVWTLRQFYHFLTLHRHVAQNIALKLPYPKIEKTVPQFLTIDEYNRLIRHFSRKTQDVLALRNLIIISDSGAGPANQYADRFEYRRYPCQLRSDVVILGTYIKL